MPTDAKVAVAAALLALLPAWLMTRSLDPSTPGWAVQVYLSLFQSSGVPPLRSSCAVPSFGTERAAGEGSARVSSLRLKRADECPGWGRKSQRRH